MENNNGYQEKNFEEKEDNARCFKVDREKRSGQEEKDSEACCASHSLEKGSCEEKEKVIFLILQKTPLDFQAAFFRTQKKRIAI